jgi:alpha-1,3-rhamnosyltransferase
MDLKIKSDLPLVSIIVITYNSSKYVLETLESAKAQTYQNIELIVSDDCSTDDTVEICRKWIEDNRDRFVRTELITFEKNTGIPANCNRSFKAAQGEWVKAIAGDDLLKFNCIEIFMKFITENTYRTAKCVFSLQQSFQDSFHKNNFKNIEPLVDNHVLYSPNSTAKEQFKSLIRLEKSIPGPTSFFNRKLVEDIGWFFEKYTLLEDFPLYLRILESGNKIFFINDITVYYRIHSESITKIDRQIKVITDFDISWNNFLRDYVFYRVSFIGQLNIFWKILLGRLILALGNKGELTRKVYYLGLKISPERLYYYLIVKPLQFLKD